MKRGGVGDHHKENDELKERGGEGGCELGGKWGTFKRRGKCIRLSREKLQHRHYIYIYISTYIYIFILHLYSDPYSILQSEIIRVREHHGGGE